jgi:hypothetical protein
MATLQHLALLRATTLLIPLMLLHCFFPLIIVEILMLNAPVFFAHKLKEGGARRKEAGGDSSGQRLANTS